MDNERIPLDQTRRGASDVSRAYRKLEQPIPPGREIDERIMQQARRVVGQTARRPRWFAPFALAASVLLSVAVVIAIVMGPSHPRRSAEPPRLVYAAAKNADLLRLREPRATHAHEAQGTSPRLYSSDPPALTPRVASQDPQTWLARIHQLRKAGRNTEADAELQRFREAFPDTAIDEASVENP